MRHRPTLLLLVLLLFACAGTARSGGAPTDRRALEFAEIRAANYSDAYTLVQALRPGWLTTRGQGSLTQREEIKVYLDGLLMGGPDYLKQISPSSISRIRFHDGLEATQRWGLDHGLGAISVSTRRVPDSLTIAPPRRALRIQFPEPGAAGRASSCECTTEDVRKVYD